MAVAAIEQQVLARAGAPRARCARRGARTSSRHAPAQARLAHRHGGDRAAGDLRRDAAARDFDFRQFGHGTRLLVQGTKYTYTRHAMSAVIRLLSLLLVLLLAAGAALAQATDADDDDDDDVPPAAAREPRAPPPNLPPLELTEPILYELLLGEIALQRGSPGSCRADLRRARQAHRDPRVARRAVEIANFARTPQYRAGGGARLARDRPRIAAGAADRSRGCWSERARWTRPSPTSRSCCRPTASPRPTASCS